MKVRVLATEGAIPTLQIVAETPQDEVILKIFNGSSGSNLIEISEAVVNGDAISSIDISVVE